MKGLQRILNDKELQKENEYYNQLQFYSSNNFQYVVYVCMLTNGIYSLHIVI